MGGLLGVRGGGAKPASYSFKAQALICIGAHRVETLLQLSAIPVPVHFTPVQPVTPIASVKGRDPSDEAGAPKLRPTPPPGVGSLIDIES